MIAFAILVAAIVLIVVPPMVWWAVTRVVPRVLGELGLPDGTRSSHEARLQRIEEAIDAIAVKVEHIARQQDVHAGGALALPVGEGRREIGEGRET